MGSVALVARTTDWSRVNQPLPSVRLVRALITAGRIAAGQNRVQAEGSEPTTLTKLTHSPGPPPRLWVSPRVRPPSVTLLI